VGGLDNSLL